MVCSPHNGDDPNLMKRFCKQVECSPHNGDDPFAASFGPPIFPCSPHNGDDPLGLDGVYDQLDVPRITGMILWQKH